MHGITKWLAAGAIVCAALPAQAASITGTHSLTVEFTSTIVTSVTPLQPGIDFETAAGDFLFDWVDGDTFAFQFLVNGDTPGPLIELSGLAFTPAGSSVNGASLAGVTLDPIDMIDPTFIEDPGNFNDYSSALGPIVSTAADSVSVAFNGTYSAGLHGDQLVWVIDVSTGATPPPGVPLPGTLLLIATSLGLLGWSKSDRLCR